jgi:uncharacterized membrane protein
MVFCANLKLMRGSMQQHCAGLCLFFSVCMFHPCALYLQMFVKKARALREAQLRREKRQEPEFYT